MTTDLNQQISNLNHITIENDSYISFESVLRTVAAAMFPDGIQAGDGAFNRVLQKAQDTLTELGYLLPAETIYPPAVPFPGGQYCRIIPQLDPKIVAAALNQMAQGTHLKPELRAQRGPLMLNIYKRAGLAGDIAPSVCEAYTKQTIAIAKEQGWSSTTDDQSIFFKPLPFDTTAATTRINDHINDRNGAPVFEDSLLTAAVFGGYGRYYEPATISNTPEIKSLIAACLDQCGYETTLTEGDYYRAKPVQLPPNAAEIIRELLTNLTKYSFPDDYNNVLYCEQVRLAVCDTFDITLTDYTFKPALSIRPNCRSPRKPWLQNRTRRIPHPKCITATPQCQLPRRIFHQSHRGTKAAQQKHSASSPA